jgi:CheY-like chemotaxis protein
VPVDDAPALLIVEDDAAFARALRRSFERHGFTVHVADGPGTLLPLPEGFAPGFAVVDLKLAGGSGLECVRLLHAHAPAMRIVVLTGYASIATAVEAIKLGARHYLPKPANTDQVAGMGTHPRNPGRDGLQHFGGGTAPGHAPAHPGAQAGQARHHLIGVLQAWRQHRSCRRVVPLPGRFF